MKPPGGEELQRGDRGFAADELLSEFTNRERGARERRMPSIEQFAQFLDALNCGALLLDRAGVVIHANRRLCEILDRPPAGPNGSNIRQFLDEVGSAALNERLARFEDPHEYELALRRADGSRIAMLVSGRLVSTGEAGLFQVLTLTDISTQKRAENTARENFAIVSKLSDTVLAQALDLKSYSEKLELRVRERTLELHQANMEAIYMLAVASEAKDLDTGAHVRRIEHYTRALAMELGCGPVQADEFAYSSILHDVGKMTVPDEILKKPGPLTREERLQIEQHTIAGERILSKQAFFRTARLIARSHHENWDGSGYPDGIAGQEIPIAARIVHLVDVFDALTSTRVYKTDWPWSEAVRHIEAQSGTLFDTEVAGAFTALARRGELGRVAATMAQSALGAGQ